jgi:hypothetical protein
MKKYSNVSLIFIGIGMLFATFFLDPTSEYIQQYISDLYSDYSALLYYGIQFLFLVPLFRVFLLNKSTPKSLVHLVYIFLIRVLFTLLIAVFSLYGQFVMIVQYTIEFWILYEAIQYFNNTNVSFVSRASLLIWAILSLSLFSSPEIFQKILDQIKYILFVLGMINVIGTLHLLEKNK